MHHGMVPDYMFRTFEEVTPAFLSALGIRAVLADIDNTLAPYEQPEPDARIRAWVAALAAEGIALALISNNDRERVERFNRTLGVPAYWKSGKPGSKTLKKAMQALGVEASQTAMLGDQILTDTLAGRRMGLATILVPPIRDKRSAFFRFKRWCEKPFVRKYKKTHHITW